MQAIETRYQGYRFRSRLEARWAVYFDVLGIEWEYEPEGFVLDDGTLYLPDFYIKDWNCYAEVKPQQFTEKEFEKCVQLKKHCLLLDTSSPLVFHGYFASYGGGGCDGYYGAYKNIDDYGRVLLAQSAHKGRLWCLYGEHPEDYWLDTAPEIAAKSARFEHGETPNVRHYGSQRSGINSRPSTD